MGGRAAEHGLDRFRLRRVLGQPPRRAARHAFQAERLARRNLFGLDPVRVENLPTPEQAFVKAERQAAMDRAEACTTLVFRRCSQFRCGK